MSSLGAIKARVATLLRRALVGIAVLAAGSGVVQAQVVPAEIVELARGLKYDPDLIYEYVHDNIETIPALGILKGPLGALIDRKGTPFDQAELMKLLLDQACAQSGATCSSPIVTVGKITMPATAAAGASSLTNWLDVEATVLDLGSGSYRGAMIGVLRSQNVADSGSISFSSSAVTSANVNWAWVKVTISGSTYVFDPATKFYNRTVGIGTSALNSALSYNGIFFLCDVYTGTYGTCTLPTTNTDLPVSSNNRNKGRGDLANYATNFIAYVRANYPGADLVDIVGGIKSIQPLTPYRTTGWTATRQTSLSYQVAPPTDCSNLSSCGGTNYRSELEINLPITMSSGLGVTWTIPTAGAPYCTLVSGAAKCIFYSSDVYGSRLSLVFDSSTAVKLRLNGVEVANGSTASAIPTTAKLSAVTKIRHPGGYSYEEGLLRFTAAQKYIINSGWGGTGRNMIERFRKQLQQYLALQNGTLPLPANCSSADDCVLGSSLAMMGATWLSELSQFNWMLDQIGGTRSMHVHGVGIVGTAAIGTAGTGVSPFVDLPFNSYTVVQRYGRDNTYAGIGRKETAVFIGTSGLASVLESGSIEQTQPKDANGNPVAAASTTKILDVAGVSYTIYAATQANWSTVKPLLSSYALCDMGRIDTLLNATGTVDPAYSSCGLSNRDMTVTHRIILPANGANLIGASGPSSGWTGVGYRDFQTYTNGFGIGELISGGQSGGFGASNIPPATIAAQPPQVAPPVDGATGSNQSLIARLGADPVVLQTGAYTYSRDDLVVGSAAFPYGLGFTRTYDSSLSTQTGGPLGNGWKHNYQITAREDSNGFQGLGDDSPASAAAAVAAIFALQDILTPASNGGTVPLLNLVVSSQTSAWLMEQLTRNVVVVSQPGRSEVFTKAPNGASYIPPLGSSSSLSLGGGVYTYQTRDGTKLTFNPAGNLDKWENAAGVAVTLGYTGSNLTSVSNGLGRSLTISYLPSTNLITQVSAGTRTVTYNQFAGQLNYVDDPMGKRTSYTYLSSGQYNYLNPGQLRTIVYPSFSTPFLTNLYDSLGRVKQQGDGIWGAINPNYPATASTLFTGSGNQASHVTSIFLAGYRTQVDDGTSTTTPNTSVTYFDQNGKTLLDIGGVWGGSDVYGSSVWTITKKYLYDGRGRLTSVILPEGNSTSYTYTDCGTTYSCATDFKWAYSVKRETQNPKSGSGLAVRWRDYTYDTVYGNVASSTDFSGNVTSYTYGAVGTGGAAQPTSICPPDLATGAARTSNCFTFAYNASGLTTRETDALGRATAYGYGTGANQADRISVTIDEGAGRLNLMTLFGFDAVGNQISVTNGNGHVTTSTFDANRRVTLITAPAAAGLGNRSFEYDNDGRVTAVKQATGIPATPFQTWSTTYTQTGQKLTQTDPSGNTTVFSYGPTDLPSAVTNPSSQSTLFFHDHFNRPYATYSALGSWTDARTYHPNGMLSYRSDGKGNYTSYIYDGFDRLKRTTLPDGKYEELAYGHALPYYNKDDDITSVTTRGAQIITFEYDRLHRRTRKLGFPVVNYTYDLMGRMLTAEVPTGNSHIPTGTWSIAYDTAGRRSVDTLPASTGGKTVRYHWDGASNRLGLTYPDNTCLLTQYDALNRVTANWSNPATSNCIQSSTGWALQWANYFDTAGRKWATLRPTTTGYTTQTLALFAEPDTLVGAIGNYLQPGAGGTFGWSASIGYSYNPQRQESGRATTASALLAHPPAATTSATYTANNVNQFTGAYIDGTTLTWDNNGNLTSDGTRTYTYDGEGAGRILNVTVGGSTVGTYTYDPFGRRFMKTAGGVTTFFVHDDQGNEIAEYNGGWALQRRLAYDPAYLAPMAMTTAAGGVTFNYFDRQGSVVAIANAAGTKITHYAYLPFGDSHPSGTPISNCQGTTCGDASGTGFGYVGYRYDQETGLYHTGARYYDPRLGRFLQMDPIGQAGGLNLYAYVLNDPLNLVDPSGLIASTAAGVVDATYSLIQNPAALGHLATGVVAGALGTSLKGGGAGLGLAGIVGDEPIAIGGGAAVYAAGRALQAYGAAEIATGLVLMNQKQGSDGGLRGSIEQEIRSSQNTGGRLVGDIGRPKAIANPDPALGRGQVRYQVRFADEFGKITNYSVNYDPATGIFGTIKPASGR